LKHVDIYDIAVPLDDSIEFYDSKNSGKDVVKLLVDANGKRIPPQLSNDSQLLGETRATHDVATKLIFLMSVSLSDHVAQVLVPAVSQ
jgi:hypothetical protein